MDQTLANLRGGKYRHLLADYEDVQLLADYNTSDVADETRAGLLRDCRHLQPEGQGQEQPAALPAATSTPPNSRRGMRSRAARRRSGIRRPLIIVYDEAHNLTDQQTDLLMELQPDALLAGHATPKLPQAIARGHRRPQSTTVWTDADLTTYVNSADVVDAGLVKRQVAPRRLPGADGRDHRRPSRRHGRGRQGGAARGCR